MKKLKMIRNIVLVVIIMYSISTYGCIIPFTKDRVVLVTQTSHAIPGARTSDVHASSQYEIIETDDYGRKLFAISYSVRPFIIATCVMQKSDDQNVYYYDNVSYLCTEKYKSYSQEQIIKLKEDNDWNKPLDATKMIKRELVNHATLQMERKPSNSMEEAQNAFYEKIEKNDKMMTFIQFFDYSTTGQELFLVSRQDNKSINGGYDYGPFDDYLMILNADGTYDPENYLIKVADLNHSNEPLTEIKEKNGWVG
jgi:hypothetical protein